jgi:hypothetical protein
MVANREQEYTYTRRAAKPSPARLRYTFHRFLGLAGRVVRRNRRARLGVPRSERIGQDVNRPLRALLGDKSFRLM